MVTVYLHGNDRKKKIIYRYSTSEEHLGKIQIYFISWHIAKMEVAEV